MGLTRQRAGRSRDQARSLVLSETSVRPPKDRVGRDSACSASFVHACAISIRTPFVLGSFVLFAIRTQSKAYLR